MTETSGMSEQDAGSISRRSVLAGVGIVAVGLVAGGSALVACAPAGSRDSSGTSFADAVFVGGPIVTVDSTMPEAGALAVKNGLILALGQDQSALASVIGSTTKIIDLAGKTLMPGFVEAHMHYAPTAYYMKMMYNVAQFVPPAPGTDSLAVLVKELVSHLPSADSGQWLLAWGYDPAYSLPLYSTPSADMLDNQVSSTVPIFLLSESAHLAWVNHKAFELAGISDTTPNPVGGVYVHDSDGHLTGELQQPGAFAAFQEAINSANPPDLGKFAEGLLWVAKTAAQAGVTSSSDLLTGALLGIEPELDMLKKLAANPATPVRIFSYLDGSAIAPADLATKHQPHEGDDRFRVTGIKLMMDGSPQGLTAAISEPYLYPEGTTNKGVLDHPDIDALAAKVKGFYDNGWQIAFHGNGDVGIEQILTVCGSVMSDTADPESRRMRIEHFTLARPDQVQKVKQLGMTVNLTPGHMYYFGQQLAHEALGQERAAAMDPARSLVDLGVRVALNSDWYFMPVSPLRCIQNAVMRTWQWEPQEVLGADEALTVDQAIRAVTLDPAYQLFMDDKVGSLEEGKWADLVILDKNPRTTDPSQIMKIRVLETYLSGVKQSTV